MQYKCQECNDTGGRDKIGAYFDCNACDTATTRRDLNDFVKSLTQRSTYPTHPEDVALSIHQRALAMAPKQEAPTFDMVPRKLVKEAIADLYTRMKKSYAAEPERRITSMDINAVFMHVARLEIGGCLDGAEEILAGMKVTAPAAANGALTDEAIMRIACDMKQRNADVWPGDIAFARAILAAAGPDAALTDAKHLVDITTAVMSQHGLIDHLSSGATQAFCDDLRAALSGAKGN